MFETDLVLEMVVVLELHSNLKSESVVFVLC